MDSGLLAAYRNLITEDTTSSPPPANHIKVLADKPGNIWVLSKLTTMRRKLPQILNALMLLLTIGRGSGRRDLPLPPMSSGVFSITTLKR